MFSLLPPLALPLPRKLWLPRLQSSHGEGDTNSQLQTIGQWGGPAQALAISGNRACLGQGSRVQVLDLSQASSPQSLGESPILPGEVAALVVDGGHALLAAGSAGLLVIDVTDDPTQPREVSSLQTPGSAHAVTVSGKLALVNDGDDGLWVIEEAGGGVRP